MSEEFENRVALVTGGSRGIGRATALRLAEEGADVAISYVSRTEEAESAVAEIRKRGRRAIAVVCDVSQPDQVAAMVARTNEDLGEISFLAHCGAISNTTDHSGLSWELWRETIDVNLNGAYLTVFAVKDQMIDRGSGSIVLISSIAALLPRGMQIHYAASKAGVLALTRCCADAFAGLEAMRRFEAGTLESTRTAAGKGRAKRKPGPRDRSIARDDPVPKPPFLGARWVEEIDPSLLFPFINEQALFRGRWGYRRGKMSADEYRDLIEGKVRPLYEKLKGRMIEHGLVRPKVAYGYFPCRSEGDVLQVEHDGRELAFPFPRQAEPPNLCIADFFKTREEGGDVAAFFVVTLGSESGEAARKLFDENEYHDYLMMHALSVELTDALAEYWHERMRDELGIGTQRPADSLGYAEQGYQGSRYGFGYPACPDLEAHETVFELLTPHRIGVTLTENMEMVPEQTTSALVAHHRQAKYFAV